MNGLSWIIYGAEVAGGIKALFHMSAFVSVVAIAGTILCIFLPTDWSSDSVAEKEVKAKTRAFGQRWAKRLPIIAFALALASVATPSKTTLMLIGASQAGEQILQLQEVQDLGGEAGALATDTIKLLRQMVSDQIETGADK